MRTATREEPLAQPKSGQYQTPPFLHCAIDCNSNGQTHEVVMIEEIQADGSRVKRGMCSKCGGGSSPSLGYGGGSGSPGGGHYGGGGGGSSCSTCGGGGSYSQSSASSSSKACSPRSTAAQRRVVGCLTPTRVITPKIGRGTELRN
uniref:Uncharacterized protein n=1 Tax=Timema tahoe TaxID=61484 RepID=A0A7R9P1C3_9NEOP|nr:unnamed protein product [Timema tahoe]